MKLVSRLTAPVLLLAVLGLGLIGIGRSLWLDETWVANSIQEPTLRGMFLYPGWLQTTPPLFLLLARGVIGLTGASNAAFRLAPLGFSLAAAWWMFDAARRVLDVPFAGIAVAFTVLDSTAIEYSHTLKQYSAELACSSALLLVVFAYLDKPDRKRLWWLLAAVAISLPLAYASVFLLPGIILAVAARRLRDAAWIAGTAAAVVLPLYAFMIRPNSTPQLYAFWSFNGHRLTVGAAAAVIFCIAVVIFLVFRTLQRKTPLHYWQYLICVLPCLLLAASAAMNWYPVSLRLRLFALPCFSILVAMAATDMLNRFGARRLFTAPASALTFGFIAYAVAGQIVAPASTYGEDYDGAVAFLRTHATAADLILVHACCQQGFTLYSRMDHWNLYLPIGGKPGGQIGHGDPS